MQRLHKLFSYEGAPDIVQSDNGGEFVAAVALGLKAVYGIKDLSTRHHIAHYQMVKLNASPNYCQSIEGC